MSVIRVGSRESRLAVIQAELVMDAIRRQDPAAELELVTMKTTGDKILDRTLDKVGGKGLFVKELDTALLEGRVDLTVHSCKDLPMEEIPASPWRASPAGRTPGTCWCCPRGRRSWTPPRPIGCASARRAVQLRALFPGVAVAPVRGNVLTRLRKLDEGQFSALVLAAAGLEAAGAGGAHHPVLHGGGAAPRGGSGHFGPPDPGRGRSCPAWTGAERRGGRTDCARAERAFVRALDGGCSAPIAAHARLEGDTVTIDGHVCNRRGRSAAGAVQRPPRPGGGPG